MADEIKQMQVASGRAYREDSVARNVADLAEELIGGKGFEVITDVAEHTPPAGQCYVQINFLADTVIADYEVDASAPIVGTITGVTWDKGGSLNGKFTSLTLTSGDVIAYFGVLV